MRMRAILTYHSVDDSGSPISVGRAEFRAHCAFLGSGRVRVVSLEALADVPAHDDAVAITFDDGFENFWSDAAPALEAHALPATVFAVPAHVGAHNDWGGRQVTGIPHLPLMSWDHLARLRERGFTLGAHTRTHPALPSVPATQLEDELGGCVADIAARTGVRPSTFAYPYGAWDATSAEAVRQRFDLACTTELRPLRAVEDRALMPRLDMYYLRAPGLLDRWGSAAFRSLLWLRSRGRQLRGLLSGPVGVARQVA
jgi:peptidoglycan/xylan/chitin deacetylase (PgdA/CDA1 family)